MDDNEIASLSEREVLERVHHELRQNITAARGWIRLLTSGNLGFSSEKQEETLLILQEYIEKMAEVNHWLEVWKSQ
jgi:hypothetical protein